MVILQVTNSFPPESIGGVAGHTYLLCQELSKRHKVHVLSRGTASWTFMRTVDTYYNGIYVRKIYLPTAKRSDYRFLESFQNKAVEHLFLNYLEDIKPDIVHVHHCSRMSAGIIRVAKDHGVPVVVTLHDYWFMCLRGCLFDVHLRPCHSGPSVQCVFCKLGPWLRKLHILPRRILEKSVSIYYRMASRHSSDWGRRLNLIFMVEYRARFLKEMLKHADRIVAISKVSKEKFAAYGIPRNQIVFLPHGIDVKSTRIMEKTDSSKIRFGYLGRLQYHKGAHIAIKAFQRLRTERAELRIYGSGDEKYMVGLKKLAHGDSAIKIFGSYRPHEVYRILSSIDILITPSICYETGPLVMFEAFASGTPVIASDIGGMPEQVVHGRNGLLFKVGDVHDLSGKMDQVLTDPVSISRLKQGIGPIMTVGDRCRHLEALYRGLISQSKSTFDS